MRTKIILVMTGLVGISLPLAAATIPVTTTDPAVAADGQCSLIEAIDNANADAQTHADCLAGSGTDIIELAPSETYVLDQVRVSFYGPNGLPRIQSPITIEGHDSTIKRDAGAPAFRILVVSSTGTLTLNDLTLEGGDSGSTYCGGGLLNAFGSVALTRTTVTGNTTGAGGGGICNSSGPMTLTESVIELNTSSGSGGGGILSLAEIADASLILEATLVRDNTTVNSGGGVYIQSETDPWGSHLQVVESTISGNHAGTAGGGMVIWRTTAEITRSTISDNIVETTEDWGGSGGGLAISDSGVLLSNSTISGNEAGGAATTVIFSGRGGGVSVIGGGWGVTPSVDTVLTVEDSTIFDNSAEVYGGGISAYRYTGTMAVEVELRNTIVAENLEGGGAVLGNCVEESPAVITSADFNLADDVTCNLIGTDDLVVADVLLASLANNGGPTMTHLPETGSPAIDSGDDAMCPEFDQHGNIRPWDGDDDGQAHCDRGAVELGAPFFADGFETGDTNGWSSSTP